MSSAPQPGRSHEVVTESGGVLVEHSDAGTENQATREPVRSLAALRLLVRERILRGWSPLPEGYQLPPGITLEDVLKPPPPFRI